MCYRTKGLAKMLQFCATQHFGGNGKKKKRKSKTKQNTTVCMHWFPWKPRCDSSSWSGAPFCSLASTKDQIGVLTPRDRSNSLSLIFEPITASASLIDGTPWPRPLGWEGPLVETSPCLACSHFSSDLTHRRKKGGEKKAVMWGVELVPHTQRL